MLNYIKADLHRIVLKKSRLAYIVVLLVISLAMVYYIGDKAADRLASVNTVSGLLPLFLGVINIPVLFGDDFKAKNMQVAIGAGVSRTKIIIAKWIETIAVGALDFLVIIGLSYAFAFALAPDIIQLNPGDFMIVQVTGLLQYIMCVGLIMFILFANQATFLGIVLYLVVELGAFEKIIPFIESMLKISRLHLESYTMSANIALLKAQALLGNISFRAIIILAIYAAISIGLSVLVFNKKELEF